MNIVITVKHWILEAWVNIGHVSSAESSVDSSNSDEESESISESFSSPNAAITSLILRQPFLEAILKSNTCWSPKQLYKIRSEIAKTEAIAMNFVLP